MFFVVQVILALTLQTTLSKVHFLLPIHFLYEVFKEKRIKKGQQSQFHKKIK